MTLCVDPEYATVAAMTAAMFDECSTLHVNPRLLYIVQNGPTILARFSVLLRFTDPQFDPLFDVLDGECFLVSVDRVEPDPVMYHCESRVMLFALLGEHDESVPHYCGDQLDRSDPF